MAWKRTIALSGLLLVAISGWAIHPDREVYTESNVSVLEAGVSLTLDQLLGLAEGENPELGAAKRRVEEAAGRRREAGLYPNPGLIVEERGVPARDVSTGNASTFAGFSQRVIVGRRRGRAVDAARSEVRLLEEEVRRVRHDVYTRVHGLYVEILYMNEAQGLQWRLLDEAQKSADVARTRDREVDVLRAEYEIRKLEAGYLAIVTQRSVAVERLQRELGGVEITLGQIEGRLEPGIDPAEMAFTTASVVENHPLVLAGEERIRWEELKTEVARAERIPDVELRGGVGYDNATEEGFLEAGIVIEIPIFDRNEGRIDEGRAAMERARRELVEAREAIQAEIDVVQQLLNELDTLAFDYANTLVPDSGEAFRRTREAYAAGDAGIVDVIDAQRAWFEALETELDYRFELNRELARLRHLRLYGVR